LTTLAGRPVAGQPVALSVRRPGTSGWAVLSTRTTGADGDFSGTHTPLTNLEYRAAWAGDTTHLPAERRTRVAVSTVVRAALSRPRVRPGGTLTLRGTVVPAHAGQKVQRQQLVRGRWTTLATATLSGAGAYTVPHHHGQHRRQDLPRGQAGRRRPRRRRQPRPDADRALSPCPVVPSSARWAHGTTSRRARGAST
jgi:hypothetical protein